ncbi:MAG: aspartate aminotransferase family protein [Desulfobacteraceae bacterium]|nr:aspartate aminotransferase family protein [Desulfobacteraceae bacterium]
MRTDGILDSTFYRNRKQQYPLIEKGEGIYLYGKDGKKYIDATCGPMTVNLGHGVREIVDAMVEQARKICFAYTGSFSTDAQINLSRKVMEFTPPGMSHVYFVSGGSEALEYAMEAARQYFLEKGEPGRTKMIGRWQSYHGATFGTLSIGGHTNFRKDYDPYLMKSPHVPPPYCYRCPFDKTYPACGVFCAKYLERLIQYEGKETIAAFISEPVSGSSMGGMTPPTEYYPIIREICDKYDILMIVDEVITGFGRTGKNFGVDHWQVIPDIIVTAKGMSSGYSPLGAVIIHEKLYEMFAGSRQASFFTGYTYAGNALSCAVGLAVLEYIQRNDLVKQVARMSEYMFGEFDRLNRLPMVGDIRGLGLLLGIELVKDKKNRTPFDASMNVAGEVEKRAFDRGLVVRAGHGFINAVDGDLVIIAPPFSVTEDEIAEILDILESVICDVCGH